MKSAEMYLNLYRKMVAPYAGAWIEMIDILFFGDTTKVAPYAGAWIEIGIVEAYPVTLFGRSLRGSVD